MGISVWQLLIILLIVLLLFGAKKLRSLGSDMGGAVKGFREAMHDAEESTDAGQEKPKIEGESHVIEEEATSKVTAKDKDSV